MVRGTRRVWYAYGVPVLEKLRMEYFYFYFNLALSGSFVQRAEACRRKCTHAYIITNLVVSTQLSCVNCVESAAHPCSSNFSYLEAGTARLHPAPPYLQAHV